MKRILLSAVLLFVVASAAAWGKFGHQTAVLLAQRHLTERAMENIRRFMPYPMKDDAVYLDTYRTDKRIKVMDRWHGCFVDSLTSRYDWNESAKNDSAPDGLRVIEYNLSKWRELPDSAVLMNIRALIHVAADLHCPVHVHHGRKEKYPCAIADRKFKSFHALYDQMPALAHPGLTPEQLAEQLDTYTRSERRKCCRGSYYDWVDETGIASRLIYRINDFGKYELDAQTIEKSAGLTDHLIQLSGYRLAYLLNRYFDN